MSTLQSDPLNTIIKAPQAYLRIAAVVLAVLAMILPAVSISMMGESAGYNITQLAPWALVFPLVLIAALVSPAVPAISPYTSLLDIAGAVLGVLAALYLVFNMGSALGPIGSALVDAGLGIGGYVLILAALVAIAVCVPRSVWSRYLKR